MSDIVKLSYKVKTPFSMIPIVGLIIAEFLSLLGNQIASIAIPLLVWQHTHSAMVTGIAAASNSLSFVVAAFVGGSAINRFGAWQISIAADIFSFISVLALPFVFILNANRITSSSILTLIFIGALFDPTGVAARHTLVPVLARHVRKPLDKVNTLRGGLEHAADFIGPVIGVSLISLINIYYTLVVNAVSFLLCALLFAVTVPSRKNKSKEKATQQIFDGLRYIFRNVQLRRLAVTGMIASMVIAAFLGLLLLLLATQRFHNTALFGISISAFGISATIGALTFSKLTRSYSYSFIYYGGLLIMGLGIMLCGVVTTQYGVVAAAALAGAAGAGNPLEQTILQEQVTKISSGQIFAGFPALRFTAGSIGLILAGLLTKIYSVTTMLLIGGVLLIITAMTGWYIAPLRKNLST